MSSHTWMIKALPMAVASSLVMAGSAHAELSSSATYCSDYTYNGCSSETLTATTETNAPISIGGTYGSASAQSDYGILSVSATGLIYNYNAQGALGIGSAQFKDSFTLLGGSGFTNVTFVARLDGTFRLNTSDYLGSASSLATNIYLASNGLGQNLSYQVSFIKNPNGTGGTQLSVTGLGATWTSADGTFSSGSGGFNSYFFPTGSEPTPIGFLSWSQSLPNNTPIVLQDYFSAVGESSISAAGITSIYMLLADGTTVSSTSGYNYATAPVPEPSEVFGLLLFGGCLAGVKFRRLNRTA